MRIQLERIKLSIELLTDMLYRARMAHFGDRDHFDPFNTIAYFISKAKPLKGGDAKPRVYSRKARTAEPLSINTIPKPSEYAPKASVYVGGR